MPFPANEVSSFILFLIISALFLALKKQSLKGQKMELSIVLVLGRK